MNLAMEVDDNDNDGVVVVVVVSEQHDEAILLVVLASFPKQSTLNERIIKQRVKQSFLLFSFCFCFCFVLL